MRALAKDFGALNDEEYDALLAVARARHAVKLVDFEKPPGAPARDAAGINRTFVSDLGMLHEPFPVAKWREQIQKALGLAAHDPVPGITKCAAPLRDSLCASLFVSDRGDVLPEFSCSYQLTCPLPHPG